MIVIAIAAVAVADIDLQVRYCFVVVGVFEYCSRQGIALIVYPFSNLI